MAEPTTTHELGDPGCTDPGILAEDHVYVLALEAGWYGDPSQPKDDAHDNFQSTVAGVIAAAAKEGT
jgi:hypothetical protein